MTHAPTFVWVATFALALASVAYTTFALARVMTLRFEQAPAAGDLPAMSVLKPLDGLEPELEENLRSFCEQVYPHYRVIFCARNAHDPALAVAERLRSSTDAEVVVASGGGAPVYNPKIANLEGAMPHVTGEIIVISDSDMTVRPDYLSAIAAAFADPDVGAVTTLYGARCTRSLPSRLGALFVNDQFAPSVLVATALAPPRYCFGATMAVRARVLAEIGGLAAIGTTIADDYALGELVTRRGDAVALAKTIPLTLVSESTLRDVLAREVRWARTIRTVRPFGYAGTIVQFPMLLSLLNAIVAPSLWGSLLLLAAGVVARVTLHLQAHRALHVPGPAAPWLVPMRELLSVVVWCGGFLGPRVRWRQGNLSVRAKGC